MMKVEKPESGKWKILVRILVTDLSAVYLPWVLAATLACSFGGLSLTNALKFVFVLSIWTPLVVSGLAPAEPDCILAVSVFASYLVVAMTVHLVLYRTWSRTAVPILLFLLSCFATASLFLALATV